MQKKTNFKKRLFLILLISISLTHLQLQAAGFKKMETNQTNAAQLLLISFVIGNIVAWSMGAHPRFYDQKPYTADEQTYIQELQQEIQSYPDEADAKKELGQIYFHHNDLDNAGKILESALKSEPDHAESLAVWGANEAKSAGAMWDFTWGLWKLSRLDDAIEGLNRAVEIEPDNINVRLFHLNTMEGLGGQNDSLKYALQDEQWYLEKSKLNSKHFPKGVQLEFLDALTRLHLTNYEFAENNNKDKSQKLALDYFTQLTLLPVSEDKKNKRIQKISEQFSKQNIPIETGK